MKDMLGRGEALSVEEAMLRLLGAMPESVPNTYPCPLEEAYAKVLAEDIESPEDLPGFSRSTMDGFAVHAADTYGTGEGNPAYLNVKYDIPMGTEPDFTLKRSEAARIATGGMLPQGADAVLMLEYAQEVGGGMIEAQRSLAPGDNVIQKGDDVKKGETLFQKGRRLRPQDVAVLGGIGISEPVVFDMPRVAIISTGDEIVRPTEPVGTGQVRDMNSFNLEGLVLEDKGVPVKYGILKDEYMLIERTVRKALEETDMVLISGGSSVGARDMTERVFEALGEVLFHSVTLKPGKPLLAGVAHGKLMFGLPGHPRAVSVCYELFVRSVLKKLSGERSGEFDRLRGIMKAKLTQRVHSSPGRQENINVTLEWRGNELWARPLLWKSGLLSTLVRAHGTMTVPLEKLGYEEGEEVEVRLL